MHIEYFKVGAVLLARGHNPTILHPSFLKNEEVVPKDWELSQDPVCTPPFAAVSFSSNFSFVVEQDKLQVNYMGENADQQTKKVAEMAGNYAAKLPYVHYTAVGINLTAFVPYEDAASFIIQHFVKDGPWKNDKLRLVEAKQNFIYAFKDHMLNMSIEGGVKKKDDQEKVQSGIVFHANYHAQCSNNDPLGSVQFHLSQAVNRKEHFKQVIHILMGEA